jgi:hypothetical protein
MATKGTMAMNVAMVMTEETLATRDIRDTNEETPAMKGVQDTNDEALVAMKEMVTGMTATEVREGHLPEGLVHPIKDPEVVVLRNHLTETGDLIINQTVLDLPVVVADHFKERLL